MGLEVNFAARDAKMEKHNMFVKNGMGKNYLKYYGDYLFKSTYE